MSKAKNFRRRGGEENAEAEDEPVVEAPSASKVPGGSVKSKQKNHKQQQLLSFAEEEEDVAGNCSNKSKGKPPRKSSLLSFGGDDDEGSPREQERKGRKKGGYGTSHGAGHKVGINREKAQTVSNILPQAGEYTPQRLQELQKNTIRYKPQPPPVEQKTEELVVVLKGSIKPVSTNEVGEQKLETSLPGEMVGEPMDVDEEGYSLDGGIPDAAAIAAAKAQRERKRIAQAAPDYIPLSSEHGDYRSRDVVEDKAKKDESSDDEAEVRGRLSFIPNKSNGNAGVFEFVENVEEEDEEKIWEEEQLKKGVGKRDPSALMGTPGLALPGGHAQTLPGFEDTLSVDQEAESVMALLHQGLKRLQESHAKTKSDLYSIEQSMAASDESIKLLENNLSTAGKKYVYMQQLRDYISSLCDFLQDKGPLIEQLEEHVLKLHEDRASALFQRRKLDRADEKVEIESAVGAAMAVLGRGGSLQMASAQAEAAISAISPTEMAPQLDEFGRDVNLQKRTEKRMRAEARKRRIARRSSLKPDAEYSSDESDSEEKAFKSGWDDAIETADKVFSDASEEFSQLELVKNRFEAWNEHYPGTYKDAYVSLSAPTIFAPFVRLEFLKWNPLRDANGFQTMKWYSLLADFEDPDLVPSLVEKIALPLLHHNLERCWDRLSMRGTVNAVAAVLEMLTHVPASSKPLQELIALVKSQLAGAVSEMEVPSWNLQVLSAVPQAAEVSAYRFGTSVKLLRNIGLWKNVLSKPVIDQLGLDELLNARILPHLRLLSPADAIVRSSRVVGALQGTWIGSDVKEMSPKLGGFIQFVVGLGKALETRKDVADLAAVVQRLRKTLIELNENERATEVAKVFQLKEL